MLKPVLKWVVRLLPFTAAIMASVAIGASTPASGTPDFVPSQSATPHTEGRMADRSLRRIDASPSATDYIDIPLIARADSLDPLTNPYPVGSLDTVLTSPGAWARSRADVRTSEERPRPDRWTSILATLALAAFFFLRRIV